MSNDMEKNEGIIRDVVFHRINSGECVLWIDCHQEILEFQIGIVNRIFCATDEVEILSPVGYLNDVSLYTAVASKSVVIVIGDNVANTIVGIRFAEDKVLSFQRLQRIIKNNPNISGDNIREIFRKEVMNNGGEQQNSDDDTDTEYLQ